MSNNLLQSEIFSSLYCQENKANFVQAQQFLAEYADQILDNFYHTLSAHVESSVFLGGDLIETQLKQALKQWLESFFSFDDNTTFHAFEENNERVGEVHARTIKSS
jgi:diguanylate cyclase